MFDQSLIKTIQDSQRSNRNVAVAQIVRREAPTSGKPGDKAVITSEGEVHGWIGGGCTKGIVIKEAMEAIRDHKPRLVKIQNGLEEEASEGVKQYRMTCMSGGSVEVYIEPIMAVSEIKIFGRSHIAKALCEIGYAAGFRINIVSDLAEPEMFPVAEKVEALEEFIERKETGENVFAVVCTQGEDDAKHLEAALALNPDYIAFVSSRKKANSILMGLKRTGTPHDKLVKINTPAGLDINAKTPQEVAISILAQIIKEKRSSEGSGNTSDALMTDELADDLYINPVCKIPVQKSTAKYVLEYKDEKVYFCCDGCKESFEKEPEAYMK